MQSESNYSHSQFQDEVTEYLEQHLTTIVDYLLTLRPRQQGLVFSTIRELLDFFCKSNVRPMLKTLVWT